MTEIDDTLAAWCDAERTADVDALDGLLTDDFVGVGPLGFTLPKPAWLGRHQSGELTYQSFDLDERQTRVHGDAAVVTALNDADGAYNGNPTPRPTRITLTLVKATDHWQIAGAHYSFVAGGIGSPPIPGPPPS